MRLRPTLLFLTLLLAACATPTSVPTPTHPAPALATATVTPAPTATAKATATATFAVKYVTPTYSPTPVGDFLIPRKPSKLELISYLKATFPNNPLIHDKYEDDVQSIWEIEMRDISGDGVPDLIVSVPSGVFIFIWAGDHYLRPFELAHEYSWFIGPHSTVSFTDWTDDKVPEIILDTEDVSIHGTGIFGSYITRYIIHCQQESCATVWQGILSSEVNDSNAGGIARFNLQLKPVTDILGRPAIRAVSENFGVYCCYDPNLNVNNDWDLTGHNVETSTVAIYSWMGDFFELTEQKIAYLPYAIKSQAVLSATSASGIQATLAVKNSGAAGEDNDVCKLLINSQNTGELFGCRGHFTKLEWKDITRDGNEELVITALSAWTSYYTFSTSPFRRERITEENCYHQRLLAYRIIDGKLNKIANVVGCVIRKDLYGVDLRDIDQDGQVEILAAIFSAITPKCEIGIERCDLDQTETRQAIYKWNGSKFVYWDDVPGE